MNEPGNTPTDKNYKPSGISRAEEAALKAYPVNMRPLVYQDLIEQFGGKTEVDINTYSRCLFQEGYELAEKYLGWHSVDESLPPMGEEVIVLSNIVNEHYISSARRISFGHIVDKEYALDYDGWNIPGVKYWMSCPELPEE